MKTFEIEIPEGYEIDTETSTFERIVFKEVKKELSVKTIYKKLFYDTIVWRINNSGEIISAAGVFDNDRIQDQHNSSTKEQLESILALNQLCNVAKYLNGDWLPKHGDKNQYYFGLDRKLNVAVCSDWREGGLQISTNVYFRTRDLANQALKILGRNIIAKALIFNH